MIYGQQKLRADKKCEKKVDNEVFKYKNSKFLWIRRFYIGCVEKSDNYRVAVGVFKPTKLFQIKQKFQYYTEKIIFKSF